MCTVHGRVQGVMYRDATRRSARALKLFGFVQNQPDGTVQIIAEGEEVVLREFLSRLPIGSLFSKVERIDEVWSDATDEFNDFQIRYRSFFDHL